MGAGMEHTENTEHQKQPGRTGQRKPGKGGRRLAPELMLTVLGLAGLFMLGMSLYLPGRPGYSDSEKRKLAEMPEMSLHTVLDGSFFSDLSSWFSDTFPHREELLGMQAQLQQLYGIRSEAVYGSHGAAEETIPEEDGSLAPTLSLEDAPDSSETSGAGKDGKSSETKSSAEESKVQEIQKIPENPAFETDEAGNLILEKQNTENVRVDGEKAGNIYVSRNAAYELFYFSQKNVTSYASMMNTVKSLLPDVNVYDMIVPNSFGVELDRGIQEKLASGNMESAIDYTYSLMDQKIKTISVYQSLLKHRGEYIYFHTDHHWTARGAYIAYQEFCQRKGITAHQLGEFERRSYDGFYGTFYFSTNRAQALKENPDTIEAFVPMGTNDLSYTNKDGVQIAGHVINDGSVMKAGNRYNTFLLGDNPFTEIDNPNVTDGSGIVLIKDSYGNAFAPFLVDHYSHVYVIDYRYYTGDLRSFIREHNVKDVLFLNNIMALGEKTSGEMLGLFH